MIKMAKKRKTSKSKIRIFVSLIVFGAVTAALGYNCLTNILKIQEMKNEKKELESELVVLQEEQEMLENDILKLEDPEYIAKYARENYMYSKDGEYIIKIEEEEKVVNESDDSVDYKYLIFISTMGLVIVVLYIIKKTKKQ